MRGGGGDVQEAWKYCRMWWRPRMKRNNSRGQNGDVSLDGRNIVLTHPTNRDVATAVESCLGRVGTD
jgi:hypothetical protein